MPIYSLCYLLGVMVSAFMPTLFSVLHLLLLALLLALLTLLVLRIDHAHRLSKHKQYLKGMLIGMMAFCLSSLHGHWLLDQQFDDQRYARDCQIKGVVGGLPSTDEN